MIGTYNILYDRNRLPDSFRSLFPLCFVCFIGFVSMIYAIIRKPKDAVEAGDAANDNTTNDN